MLFVRTPFRIVRKITVSSISPLTQPLPTWERRHRTVISRTNLGCPLSVLLWFTVVSLLPASFVSADTAKLDFFESKIRPVLVEHCHSCHSDEALKANKLQAGLRLDSKQMVFEGGDSGQVIASGDAGNSLLISALKYDDLEMPPKGKLPPKVIADFEVWVNDGAVWPEETASRVADVPEEIDYAKWRQSHWAWKPVSADFPERSENDSWSRSAIDMFVYSLLRDHLLKPSQPASRATWFRRMHFDLLGLPPRHEDIVAFEDDASPEAFERAVDRILASPHFGEHWGRHWLDIARYADNGGFNSQTKELYTNYPFAFTYRDYVIRSYNDDVPYDQFIVEQLAADKLPRGEDNRSLAALGFLTLGDASFGVSREDRIDDCIDTVTRGLMGTTVSCARCHDHKYDPVPMADYYSLFGIFQNSNVRVLSRLHTLEKSQRLPAIFASNAERERFETDLRTAEDALTDGMSEARRTSRQHCREKFAEYLLVEAGINEKANHQLDENIIKRLREGIEKAEAVPLSIWKAFRSLGKEATEVEIGKTVQQLTSEQGTKDSVVFEKAEVRQWKHVRDAANTLQAIFRELDESSSDLSEAQQRFVSVWAGDKGPFQITDEWLLKTYVHGQHDRLKKLVERRDTIRFDQPRAVSLADNQKIVDSHILIRGAAGKKGAVVPRQFLALLSNEREAFTDGSGRLELARAIADKSNPLTARVMVNRIWSHLMGRGFVDTPGDFGTRCEAPIHLHLLDYLAYDFMRNDWSVKKLLRTIVLSSTYRQSSNNRTDVASVDPDNRLLWKMNRKRLQFESLRDSLLVAAGHYDQNMGGPADDLWQSNRRSIYGYVNRYRIADGYLTFDFPNPSRTADKRLGTLVPQQSLFLMNSPYVETRVDQVVALSEFTKTNSDPERIQFLFRQILSRDPQPTEELACRQFLASRQGDSDPSRLWRQLAHGLFLSNEFMYID